jgi:hypothetical protein
VNPPQPLGCLLDENLDPSLVEHLATFLERRVSTLRTQGWLGMKNGPLLEAMVDLHFGVLVTGDRTLYRERRELLSTLGIGVVLVRDPANAAARVEQIARAVERVRAGELVEVPPKESVS